MKQDYILSKDAPKSGSAFLIYGKPNVGKSGSLSTCKGNLLAINAEDKDLGVVVSQIPDFDQSLRIVGFDTFDEYIEFLEDLHGEYVKGNRPYDIIFFDGLSFLQSNFRMDFEDSRFDLGLSDKDAKGNTKRANTIADRFRIEMQDWGGLASAMMRITKVLVSFTVFDVNVIATAHESINPKWNRDVEVAPSFAGKGYSSIMSGYWHYIGWVTPGDKLVNGFPMPVVRFMSSDGTFIARSSSNKLNERMVATGGYAPLNWDKILKVIGG